MREKVIEILEENLVDMPEDINTCIDIVSGGYLDSLDIISFVMDLNDEFDINIRVSELTEENFDSIDAIVKLIEEVQ